MSRWSVSSLGRARSEQGEPRLLPPQIANLGSVPYGPQDYDALSGLLGEPGWPRTTMNIVMLEGYLVALLVLPIDVAPGAWMPPIWGEAGWKVPMILRSGQRYSEFTRLIVALLQDLERDLDTSSATDAFATRRRVLCAPNSRINLSVWAVGFRKAAEGAVYGLLGRSQRVHENVATIVSYALPESLALESGRTVAMRISSAIEALHAERSSRGPLGSLAPRIRAPKLALTPSPKATKSVTSAPQGPANGEAIHPHVVDEEPQTPA
jgi:Uncharacterised protein family (UPF0149)